jgi:hypothetical protein
LPAAHSIATLKATAAHPSAGGNAQAAASDKPFARNEPAISEEPMIKPFTKESIGNAEVAEHRDLGQ